jgi:hypothetical protein
MCLRGNAWIYQEEGKITRGLKVDDTPILHMNQIYYNFIGGHQALGCRTPAEIAAQNLVWVSESTSEKRPVKGW